MRYLLFSVYTASVANFAMGSIRDFMVITSTTQPKFFFEVLYFSSLISSFLINAMTLGGKPTLRFVCIGVALTLVGGWVAGSLFFPLTMASIVLALIVTVLWIVGAIASRLLINSGEIFLGRFREGVAALATCFLMSIGVGLELTFVLGVAVGSIWVLWLTRSYSESYFSSVDSPVSNWSQFVDSLIANIPTSLVLSWAIWMNQYPKQLWGHDSAVVARLSVYLFQILTIGAIVLSVKRPHLPCVVIKNCIKIFYSSIFFALVTTIASPKFSVLIVPLLAAISHYAGVFYIHEKDSSVRKLDAL